MKVPTDVHCNEVANYNHKSKSSAGGGTPSGTTSNRSQKMPRLGATRKDK